MATHKHITAICVGITVLTLLLTVLFMNGEALGLQPLHAQADSMFSSEDLDGGYDLAGATRIELNGDRANVAGNGAYFYQGDLYIVYGGKYVLSGTLDDGSVVVQADGDDRIFLYLDGADITCQDGAALVVEQAGKVFLTLGEGTENRLTSGTDYAADVLSAGIDGAVYSRDDLTINGSGSLAVTAGYKHGIVCNDDLIITAGDLFIEAPQDGIHANDSVRVREATLSIQAGDDGVTVDNDEGTGYFYMESGTLTAAGCYEGIEAANVTIAGGTLDLTPTDDGINATGSGGFLRITGGEIRIVNETGRDADGLDSNGDIFIEGGRLLISVNGGGGNLAIDYGSENGGVCRIDGGTVLACGSGTMVEAISAESTQGFLMEMVTGQAGSKVSLEAGDSVLLSEEVPCGFTCVVVSAPGLEMGQTVTLKVGETSGEYVAGENSQTVGGFGPMGGFGGGNFGQGGFGQRPEAPSGGGDETLPEGGPGFGGMPGGQFPGQGGQQPDMEGQMPDQNGQMPGFEGRGLGGRFPNGQQPEGGRFGGGDAAGQTAQDAPQVSMETILTTAVLVGVSLLALGIGLLAAWRFRR